MECFDGNVLEYHYFMTLFREVVESKTEDPRGRLTRLIKYTVGDPRDLIKHCIQLPSNEEFTQAKYLLEKMYGKPHRILASYRKEVKDWPQIKFGDSIGFRKFHSFLLKCRSVAANQRWNTLNSLDILCMMASKLPDSLTGRWNREVANIRRHHRREPDLEDFIMYIEEETMLMSDPLFSRELNTVKERSSRRNKVKGFLTVSDGKAAADDKNNKKPPHCPLCNNGHDLDECRNFNEMEVVGRSKFLSKQKLCYVYCEKISQSHTARNCPNRRTSNICAGKHPTGLHGFNLKRKGDNSSSNDDKTSELIKSNCASVHYPVCSNWL